MITQEDKLVSKWHKTITMINNKDQELLNNNNKAKDACEHVFQKEKDVKIIVMNLMNF